MSVSVGLFLPLLQPRGVGSTVTGPLDSSGLSISLRLARQGEIGQAGPGEADTVAPVRSQREVLGVGGVSARGQCTIKKLFCPVNKNILDNQKILTLMLFFF